MWPIGPEEALRALHGTSVVQDGKNTEEGGADDVADLRGRTSTEDPDRIGRYTA